MRIQAIFTELVFEHALRIRMKAETSDATDAGKSGENTAIATPDTASQVGDAGEGESGEGSQAGGGDPGDSATSSSSTAVTPGSAAISVKGKGKATPEDSSKKAAEQAKQPEDKKEGKNLVGRINNLVTSDLDSLEPIAMFFPYTGAFPLWWRYVVCKAYVSV